MILNPKYLKQINLHSEVNHNRTKKKCLFKTKNRKNQKKIDRIRTTLYDKSNLDDRNSRMSINNKPEDDQFSNSSSVATIVSNQV